MLDYEGGNQLVITTYGPGRPGRKLLRTGQPGRPKKMY